LGFAQIGPIENDAGEISAVALIDEGGHDFGDHRTAHPNALRDAARVVLV
jgi:hypothetical protein